MDIYKIGRQSSSKDVKPKMKIGDVPKPKGKKRKEYVEVPVEKVENPVQQIYEATKRALQNIFVRIDDRNYEPIYIHPKDQVDDMPYIPYFKNIKIDNGQFNRILLDDNEEYDMDFPAALIRFIDMRYLVEQQRVGEGRSTMRIHVIMNNLNNSDDTIETMPFRLLQLINLSMQKAKTYEIAFTERLNLLYQDMPEKTKMLQAYWIDYEVWYKDFSTWVYNDYERKYIVIPPFTNHSDAPEHDDENHGDHKTPTYEDSEEIDRLTNETKK